MTDLDRRDVLKLMGLGFVSVGTVGSLARAAAAETLPRTTPPPAVPTPPEPESFWLLAPLTVGSRVASAQLKSVEPIHDGVLTVHLELSGEPMQVHICKRDDGLKMPPPARSRHYDFLLANGGKGDVKTSRATGEVVVALSRVVRSNETSRPVLPLVTMRQRWASMNVPC